MTVGIVIVGALGRMGREIAEVALADPECSLRGAVEYDRHPLIGKDYGSCMGKEPVKFALSASIAEIECSGSVCIDFSSPAALPHLLPLAAEKRAPLVVGTTGLSDNDLALAERFASGIPILVSPNMSLGVNLLFLLTEMVSSRLKNDYDI